jgi:hypothetical protein
LGLAHANIGELEHAIAAFTGAIGLAEVVQLGADPSCSLYRSNFLPTNATLTGASDAALSTAAVSSFSIPAFKSPNARPRCEVEAFLSPLTPGVSPLRSLASTGCQPPFFLTEQPLIELFQNVCSALLAERTEGTTGGIQNTGKISYVSAAAASTTTPTSNIQRLALCHKLSFRFTRFLLKTRSVYLSGIGAAADAARDALRLRLSATHERAKVLQLAGRHIEAVSDFTDVIVNCPTASAAFFRRGLSLRLMRCFTCAADDLETARTMLPRDQRFNVNYHALHDITAIVVNAAGEEPISDVVGLPDNARREICVSSSCKLNSDDIK